MEYKKRLDCFLRRHFVDGPVLFAESYDFQTLVGKTAIERVQGALNVELYARNKLI